MEGDLKSYIKTRQESFVKKKKKLRKTIVDDFLAITTANHLLAVIITNVGRDLTLSIFCLSLLFMLNLQSYNHFILPYIT